ncbi:tRNA-i(6)A37 methylthiotransferase [Candidatus Nasuia deltocephalinicola str. NAS-ALF]|uniref:tRNA-i(6)A37 methylthiotransferase n=1 Tax=Candidatus Nasuia deltocephalinicola str. NAS-ALF TaxID=1343077 RepID=S5SQ79_9PROT|nr:tRNA-i(6)A37 methylthiotransferase [Candidatus Nasuia deltocephalinicola str. NAS-ALF]
MKFIIKTLGCQSNLNYSKSFYYFIKPFSNINNIYFDILLINTCSVRELCHKRIFFLLKKNYKLKFLRIFNGCLINLFYLKLIKKSFVNIIINNAFTILKILIYNFYFYNCKQLYLKNIYKIENYKNINIIISEGCDKYCNYCIIPYTRGREIFYDLFSIFKNILLISVKFKEIYFFGQNVNSYKSFLKDKIIKFYLFIKIINEINKNNNYYYLTSNVKYAILYIKIYKNNKFLHLPLQSASNSILESMNRKYNFNFYKSFIYKVKKHLKDFLFSTDIIICFPGEIHDLYNKTLLSIEKLLFDKSYIFIYNVRSFTNSIFFFNNINLKLKKKRFIYLKKKFINNIFYINKLFINKYFYFILKNILLSYNHLFFSFLNNRKIIFFIKYKYLKINKFLKMKIKKIYLNRFFSFFI